ncbi:MAG TPA: hypothetical protein VH482_29230 [Thermomicrobiales bacterium]
MFHRRRHSTFVLATLLALMAAFALSRPLLDAAAQNATPAASTGSPTLPIAPDPSLCKTEKRPVEDSEALIGTPAPEHPEPVVLTAGKAADQATVDAVIATVIEIAACTNAYGLGGHDGLYTDAGFIEDSLGLDQESIDFLNSPENAAMFADPADWFAIYDVSAIQVLADGRVAAIVQFGRDSAGPVDLMIFAAENGRLLIDHWVDEPFDIVLNFGDGEESAAATPTS